MSTVRMQYEVSSLLKLTVYCVLRGDVRWISWLVRAGSWHLIIAVDRVAASASEELPFRA